MALRSPKLKLLSPYSVMEYGYCAGLRIQLSCQVQALTRITTCCALLCKILSSHNAPLQMAIGELHREDRVSC